MGQKLPLFTFSSDSQCFPLPTAPTVLDPIANLTCHLPTTSDTYLAISLSNIRVTVIDIVQCMNIALLRILVEVLDKV